MIAKEMLKLFTLEQLRALKTMIVAEIRDRVMDRTPKER